MRIIISPAKKMRVDTDSFDCRELPVFLDRTETLMNCIRGLSYKEQKKLWACSDKIAQENAERFAGLPHHKAALLRVLCHRARPDPAQTRNPASAPCRDDHAELHPHHLL